MTAGVSSNRRRSRRDDQVVAMDDRCAAVGQASDLHVDSVLAWSSFFMSDASFSLSSTTSKRIEDNPGVK